MLEKKLEDEIKTNLLQLLQQGLFPGLNQQQIDELPIKVERAKIQVPTAHFSSGVAMQISSLAKIPAMQVSDLLAKQLARNIAALAEINISRPGFINFKVNDDSLLNVLQVIYRQYFQEQSSAEQVCRPAKNADYESANIDMAFDRLSNDVAFFVQYTHARCCSLLQLLGEPVLDYVSGIEGEALLSKEYRDSCFRSFQDSTTILKAMFVQADEKLLFTQRELILLLDSYGAASSRALRKQNRKIMFNYCVSLSEALERFCALLCPASLAQEVLAARVGLLFAAKFILARSIESCGAVPAASF